MRRKRGDPRWRRRPRRARGRSSARCGRRRVRTEPPPSTIFVSVDPTVPARPLPGTQGRRGQPRPGVRRLRSPPVMTPDPPQPEPPEPPHPPWEPHPPQPPHPPEPPHPPWEPEPPHPQKPPWETGAGPTPVARPSTADRRSAPDCGHYPPWGLGPRGGVLSGGQQAPLEACRSFRSSQNL